MKKQLTLLAALVVGLVAVAVLAASPFAAAQTPAPTCSTALQALTAAQAKAVATQADVDRLKADQTPLDAAVVAAQKLVDNFVIGGPKPLAVLMEELANAKTLAGVGNAKLQAAITADAAADAAVVAAQAAADKACQGAPGATVTTTPPPPPPVVVTIPSAINTGFAL